MHRSLFFNKLAGLTPPNLLKKKLRQWCFSVDFVKFLRMLFLQNSSWRLLVYSTYPVDTGCKLNVHKTSRTSSESLMYVQFTSCVYRVVETTIVSYLLTCNHARSKWTRGQQEDHTTTKTKNTIITSNFLSYHRLFNLTNYRVMKSWNRFKRWNHRL